MSFTRRWCVSFVAMFMSCFVATVASAINYNETAQGDLSNTFSAPTLWGTLTAGTNSLTGNVGISGDLDYVRVDIPANGALSQIILQSYTSTNGIAFMGVEAGTAFTKSNTQTTAADLLGYVHFGSGAGNVGTDVLDDMGTASGAQGFTPPLGTGSYSFWIQNTTQVLTAYQFDFIVSTVPEPSTVALFGLSAGALLISIRIRRSAAAQKRQRN
jgi:hypothetical protein